ncbi:MAG: hypothetical protein EOP73_30870, partial [Variovorax sp.]
MTQPPPRRAHIVLLLAVFSALGSLSVGPAAGAEDDDLPETLRRGYLTPITGPADSTAYARGRLGLVRTSYGRASLY